jgi:hypothetical protein
MIFTGLQTATRSHKPKQTNYQRTHIPPHVYLNHSKPI